MLHYFTIDKSSACMSFIIIITATRKILSLGETK